MTEAVAVAITAVDAIMDVITAAIMAVADGVFPAEITPAATFCGSSFSCVCAETTAGDAAMAVAMVTTAGSLSFCSCCAATMAAVAAADTYPFISAEQGITFPCLRQLLILVIFNISAFYLSTCFLLF